MLALLVKFWGWTQGLTNTVSDVPALYAICSLPSYYPVNVLQALRLIDSFGRWTHVYVSLLVWGGPYDPEGHWPLDIWFTLPYQLLQGVSLWQHVGISPEEAAPVPWERAAWISPPCLGPGAGPSLSNMEQRRNCGPRTDSNGSAAMTPDVQTSFSQS